jgi:hypothetical protein
LTPPRFLIDENLSVKLPELAHKRGFEASHVQGRAHHPRGVIDAKRIRNGKHNAGSAGCWSH